MTAGAFAEFCRVRRRISILQSERSGQGAAYCLCRPFRIMKKKLYRDTANEQIAGVCSGFAKYFDIDATIIRLVWAILIFCAGTGLLAYVICAIIIPEEPDGYQSVDFEDVE